MVTVADTAYSIAVVRAEEASLPEGERLFDDPFAKLFAAAGAHCAEATQRFLELDFFHAGVRLRTRYLDDAVREGIAAGLDQLVLLGAGFDARGMRLNDVAAKNVRVFEVDFSEQLEKKRSILTNGGVVVPAHIAYVACDFMQPDFDVALLADLEAKGFRKGAGAVFVWEGVIGYIDLPAIEKSLRFMLNAGGKGSRVAFTYGPMTFDPDTAETYTRRLGFASCTTETGADLWRRHFKGDPSPPDAAALMKMGTLIV